MKYWYIISLICISACHQKNKLDHKGLADENASTDTIPEVRDTIGKSPVASYSIPMGDPRLERKFGVEIYETNYTFKYLLVMQYDAMVQTDTLKLPNFGTWPVVKVKPGKEKLSCIIGFLMRKIILESTKCLVLKMMHLKLTVLKSYGISAY